jgi:hypothetical protein
VPLHTITANLKFVVIDCGQQTAVSLSAINGSLQFYPHFAANGSAEVRQGP